MELFPGAVGEVGFEEARMLSGVGGTRGGPPSGS